MIKLRNRNSERLHINQMQGRHSRNLSAVVMARTVTKLINSDTHAEPYSATDSLRSPLTVGRASGHIARLTTGS